MQLVSVVNKFVHIGDSIMKTLLTAILYSTLFTVFGPLSHSNASQPDARKQRADLDQEVSNLIRLLDDIVMQQERTTRLLNTAYFWQAGGPLRELIDRPEPQKDNDQQRIPMR